MAKRPPAWYWDACIFMAWLNAEDDVHGPAVMEGIREMVRDSDGGRAVVFTSVMTKTEIYHRLKTQWAKDEYNRFCQRPNTSVIAQDDRIGDKSSDIRAYYSRKGITLDAGDSIHLATAILYEANVFYTLDGNADKPKPNALLPLNGDVAGYPLRIQMPHAQQGSLFAGIPTHVSSALKGPAAKTPLKVVASNPHKRKR